MSWNYRLLEKEYEGEPYYVVVEVYYDDEGGIQGWTDKAYPLGSTLDELKEDLRYFNKALDKPVLIEKELPGYEK